MSKLFWIPLIASFGTMILLFTIGNLAGINFMIFKFSLSHTEISLLPIIVGILIGFITERMLKFKNPKNKSY